MLLWPVHTQQVQFLQWSSKCVYLQCVYQCCPMSSIVVCHCWARTKLCNYIDWSYTWNNECNHPLLTKNSQSHCRSVQESIFGSSLQVNWYPIVLLARMNNKPLTMGTCISLSCLIIIQVSIYSLIPLNTLQRRGHIIALYVYIFITHTSSVFNQWLLSMWQSNISTPGWCIHCGL